MPRKYRPPESRRRKARKTVSPHILEQGDPVDDATVEPETVEIPEETVSPITTVSAPLRSGPQQSPRQGPAKHIARDYSYVRQEVARIAITAGFLIVALVITSVLRD